MKRPYKILNLKLNKFPKKNHEFCCKEMMRLLYLMRNKLYLGNFVDFRCFDDSMCTASDFYMKMGVLIQVLRT